MDSLSSILLLALLTWGQATSFTTVTQIPRSNQDVFSEAVTEEFIVEQQLPTSSQAPQNMTTTQGRSTTAGGEEGSAMVESHEDEEPMIMIFHPTTPEPTTTEHTTPEPTTTEHTTPESTSTLSTSANTILLNEQNDMPIEDTTTTEPSESKQTEMTTRANIPSTMSDLGSGLEESSSADPNMFLSLYGSGATEEPVATTMENTNVPKRGRALAVPINKPMPQENVTTMPKGHVTPDWIIIVGFLVGLAALVLVCVAIATREKWNGPNQFNSTGVTITPVDQQSEVEMEEFLHKKHQRDNGKTDEYTIIPLDELPDTYSS
ncbi:hypothetical protein NQD34_001676 [Periophthalmus magnuspinnatus]|nr:hypothetical protein NQD34_001676 [Periophthalmus magnuspinnatus]